MQTSTKVVRTEVTVLMTTDEHVLKWKDVVNPPQEIKTTRKEQKGKPN